MFMLKSTHDKQIARMTEFLEKYRDAALHEIETLKRELALVKTMRDSLEKQIADSKRKRDEKGRFCK